MNEEKFKVIVNTNYEVSDKGIVRNRLTDYILKPSIDRYGYLKIHIVDINRKPLHKTIHRLVAETWLVQKCTSLQVNHIDGNKLNNNVCNLEWVSVSENIRHSYDKQLNDNANPIQMFDLQTDQIFNFRSLKDTARYLGICLTAFVPLIRNSTNNPILDRYIVMLDNENGYFNTSNTINFGKPVFVYDLITEQLVEYPSILSASYFTGIRSLRGDYNKPEYKIGYFITKNKDNVQKILEIDKTTLQKERNRYINEPYRQRDIIYYLYDYFTKIECVFETIDECLDFLISKGPYHKCPTKENISSSIHDGIKRNKSSLVRGFGIKSSLQDCDWFPYSEEHILCSKQCLSAPVRVYKVVKENQEKTIFGLVELCNYLNYRTDSLFKNITLELIMSSINIPNLNVYRLNNPVK